MFRRGRRLRTNSVIRNLVRENSLSVDDFIYPVFVVEGNNIKREISSLKGNYHWSVDKLDELVNQSEEKTGIAVPPKGKYFFGSVVVGERGQIVIPKEARTIFNINTGDKLLILGDEERGLGIVHQRDLINFVGTMGVAMKDE